MGLLHSGTFDWVLTFRGCAMDSVWTIPEDRFRPAETITEASLRILALTGRGAGSRGPKRALIALRDSLGLSVEITRTNAFLGERLAEVLGVSWAPSEFVVRSSLTLEGLNALLRGATEAFERGELRTALPPSPTLPPTPEWVGFVPARTKLEAVNRIAALTGAPSEWLGPGGKEHRSVLDNLAERALPDATLDRTSKTRLARSIAEAFGVTWTDRCHSTGETISLEGLNTLLVGAERYLRARNDGGSFASSSPESEASLLLAALRSAWDGAAVDGRSAVEWLIQREARGAFDNEWQGFYFEQQAREIIAASVGPSLAQPRVRFGNTTFDLARNYVWEFKTHASEKLMPESRTLTAQGGEVILNDEEAMQSCVSEQGLGVIVLSGRAIMDDDDAFLSWHRRLKEQHGRQSARSNSGRSRQRKAAFMPLRLEAFWIPDDVSFVESMSRGLLARHSQGRQAPRGEGESGAPRASKLRLDLGQARDSLLVASQGWPVRDVA